SILVAEDDEEDRMLLMDAMQEGRLRNSMTFVHDGEQLLDYLAGRGTCIVREFPFLISPMVYTFFKSKLRMHTYIESSFG
ncbi:MAG: hypothetical protein AAFQ92_25550, partial [Bacteroidota bacterium]